MEDIKAKLTQVISDYLGAKEPTIPIDDLVDELGERVEIYSLAKEGKQAPLTIARAAILWSAGKSYAQIGAMEWPSLDKSVAKKRAERLIKKNISEYPSLYKAKNK